MKRTWIKGIAGAACMALLLMACGQKETAEQPKSSEKQVSAAESVAPEASEASEAEETQPEETGSKELGKEDVKTCTYVNVTDGAMYLIDMVTYPSWDSGQGKLENLKNGYYLGVSNYTKLTPFGWEEADMANVSKLEDVPEVLEEAIAATFNEVRYGGASLSIYDFQNMDYSVIEDVGEINGYPSCYFAGDYVFKNLDGEELRYAVAGYTAFLKQSGWPIYVAAINTTEDQPNTEELKELSYNCFKTLREVTEEELQNIGQLD
ncbi:MAG: hypothetical protein ACLTKI_03930 [Lachnospiraceae bacterium]